jgi:hypothetical protein
MLCQHRVNGMCWLRGVAGRRVVLVHHARAGVMRMEEVSVEVEINVMEGPSRSRGDGGWGFHLGTARDNALMLRAILRYEFVSTAA